MRYNDARQHRTILRTLVLITIMSIVGVLFTAGTASAVPADCLRAGEPTGPCAQELEFPATFPTTALRGMILIIAGGGWQSTQPYLLGDPDRTFSGLQGVSPAQSWSPLTLRAQPTMPVLVGHAKNDTVVFPSQTRTFCTSALPTCRAVYLAAGNSGVADFTHADVDDRALARFRNTEQSFVCSAVASWSGPCP